MLKKIRFGGAPLLYKEYGATDTRLGIWEGAFTKQRQGK